MSTGHAPFVSVSNGGTFTVSSNLHGRDRGDDTINILANGSTVRSYDGDDSIVADRNSSISGGTGNNIIRVGNDATVSVEGGSDSIYVGHDAVIDLGDRGEGAGGDGHGHTLGQGHSSHGNGNGYGHDGDFPGNDTINVGNNATIEAGGSDNRLIEVGGSAKILLGTGNDTVNVHGNATISDQGGNNRYTIGGSQSSISGGATSRDSISLARGNHTISEDGRATISSHFGSATLASGDLTIGYAGGTSADSITVTDGSATIIGANEGIWASALHSTVSFVGGSGADTFLGGSSTDTMTGNAGSDLFSFGSASAGGVHTIKDFSHGQDLINIQGYGSVDDILAHNVSYSGGNAIIDLGDGTTITLKGVTSLNKDDFTS